MVRICEVGRFHQPRPQAPVAVGNARIGVGIALVLVLFSAVLMPTFGRKISAAQELMPIRDTVMAANHAWDCSYNRSMSRRETSDSTQITTRTGVNLPCPGVVTAILWDFQAKERLRDRVGTPESDELLEIPGESRGPEKNGKPRSVGFPMRNAQSERQTSETR